MTRITSLLVVALFAAFTLPSDTFAQSTNVTTRNTNQSTKFKSGVFKGSANLIQSNSVTSFIGAGQSNSVLSGADYAVLGGGFGNLINNDYGTVSGGGGNTASGGYATVGGGFTNTASGISATVGGGIGNTASDVYATVGGGYRNTASGSDATAGGGFGNTASGDFATVGGGFGNTASQSYATVPGGARAFATNTGAFVWSGDDSEDTGSFGNNTFTVRAEGGVRFYSANGAGTGVSLAAGGGAWTTLSDRNAKENFDDVDASEVLAKVAAMPIKTWNYTTQADSIRHIGPTAQDFKVAFGVGESDTGITTVDADGVALAAIKGLVEELKERDAKIGELEAKLGAMEQRLNSLPPAP